MLVCNVSLRPPRRAIAADIAEATAAADATATGQVVFATLVDDPASVGDVVDAYLGEIMVEAASAAAAVSAGLIQAAAIVETATAIDTSAVVAVPVDASMVETAAASDMPDAGLIYAATIAEPTTATTSQDATVTFTPLNLSGLIGWWSIYTSADYTVSGTQVVSMVDKSGSGNTLGDGSTFQKPTYSATGLNSLPTMLCDGSLTHIDKTSFPMGTGNTLTVFGVAILTSASGNFSRLAGYAATGFNDNNSVRSWNFQRNGTTANMRFERNSVATPQISTSYTTPHRFIATINSSGVMTVYIDGVASSTATSSGNWTTNGNLRVGGDNGSIARWASAISEIGVATGFTNSTDVASLDLYLKNKWGL